MQKTAVIPLLVALLLTNVAHAESLSHIAAGLATGLGAHAAERVLENAGTMKASAMPASYGQPVYQGRVVRILDGDTADILHQGGTLRIRLAEIDAPEIGHGRGKPGQPYGQQAKQTLSELIYGRDVRVVQTDRRLTYGRMVGRIYLGQMDVNAEMLRRGMAWSYTRYANDPALIRLAREAQSSRVGLWKDSNPVPPWKYRHP